MTVEFKLKPPAKPYYLFEAKANKDYWICMCRKSKNFPFCDGMHAKIPGNFSPEKIQYPENKDVFICACGKTQVKPHCDGTHKTFDWKLSIID